MKRMALSILIVLCSVSQMYAIEVSDFINFPEDYVGKAVEVKANVVVSSAAKIESVEGELSLVESNRIKAGDFVVMFSDLSNYSLTGMFLNSTTSVVVPSTLFRKLLKEKVSHVLARGTVYKSLGTSVHLVVEEVTVLADGKVLTR